MPRTKATKKRKKTTARKTKTRGRKASGRKTTAGKRKTTRAGARRKTTKRKATSKKSVTLKIGKKAFKKSEIYNYIADATELSKKEIVSVFEELGNIIHGHLKKTGPGEFTLPGLLKCTVRRKPATKARRGINPFTGEETTFKAKPARNVVKVRPLKKLKEMVS